jgi:hypothetical protein
MVFVEPVESASVRGCSHERCNCRRCDVCEDCGGLCEF